LGEKFQIMEKELALRSWGLLPYRLQKVLYGPFDDSTFDVRGKQSVKKKGQDLDKPIQTIHSTQPDSIPHLHVPTDPTGLETPDVTPFDTFPKHP